MSLLRTRAIVCAIFFERRRGDYRGVYFFLFFATFFAFFQGGRKGGRGERFFFSRHVSASANCAILRHRLILPPQRISYFMEPFGHIFDLFVERVEALEQVAHKATRIDNQIV